MNAATKWTANIALVVAAFALLAMALVAVVAPAGDWLSWRFAAAALFWGAVLVFLASAAEIEEDRRDAARKGNQP